MKKHLLLVIIIMFITSCSGKHKYSSENNSSYSDEVSDGTYCAEIEYYNPNTGTRSTYTLNVEVENEELTQIDWPNGGWLDETHFTPTDISSGSCEFTSDKGYEYTVTLGEKGGCNDSQGHNLRDAVNNDVENTTCPICGGEKDKYDEMCDDCKDKKEHTCPNCGGYKLSVYDELCDDCQGKKNQE